MPPFRPIAERFWEKVQKGAGCWLWTAAVKRDGYGILGINGKPITAHRIAWQLTNGAIPRGMHVLHNCDNPRCVNPAHLRLGTHQDNMRDAAERSIYHTREQNGEKNASAKLSNGDVSAIRQLLAKGEQQKCIAARFSVSRATVCMIAKGKRWASSS